MIVLLRSIGVGAVATALDLALLALLVDGLHLDPHAANVPALFGGMIAQFVGNKLFAFEDRSRDWAKQGVWFGLIEVGALVLNALLFELLVAHVPYLFARIVGSSLVYFGFSLPLWSRIFRKQEALA